MLNPPEEGGLKEAQEKKYIYNYQWIRDNKHTSTSTQEYLCTPQGYVWVWLFYICQGYELIRINTNILLTEETKITQT